MKKLRHRRIYETPRGRVTVRKDGGWRLDVYSLRSLSEALSPDLLGAFVCCFVHSDRLTSLCQLVWLSRGLEGRPAFLRNIATVHYLSAGILREFAFSIRNLRAALHKRGWLDQNDEAVKRLRDIEKRWDSPDLVRFRDKVAFHVDPEGISSGIEQLVAQDRAVTVADSDGDKDFDGRFPIALEALARGHTPSAEERKRLDQTIRDDLRVYLSLHGLFEKTVTRSGLRIERVDE